MDAKTWAEVEEWKANYRKAVEDEARALARLREVEKERDGAFMRCETLENASYALNGSSLAQLEAAVEETMRLVKECEQEYTDRQGERIGGWWVPLDALRGDIRRIRGQREGPLRPVKQGEDHV